MPLVDYVDFETFNNQDITNKYQLIMDFLSFINCKTKIKLPVGDLLNGLG